MTLRPAWLLPIIVGILIGVPLLVDWIRLWKMTKARKKRRA